MEVNLFQNMKTILTFLLVLSLCAAVNAQDPSKAVTAKGYISTDKVNQGGSFAVAVVLDIDPQFHINSAKPLDENLIPTKVEPLKVEGFTFSTPTYPKGETQKFAFSDEALSVYGGRTVIKFKATAAKTVPLGLKTIKVKLGYQACNNQACFAPKTVEIPIEVEVVKAGVKVSPANTQFFSTARR